MRKIIAYILIAMFVCLSLNAISIAALNNDSESVLKENKANDTIDKPDLELEIDGECSDDTVIKSPILEPFGQKTNKNSELTGISLNQNQPSSISGNYVSPEKMRVIEKNIRNSNLGYIFNENDMAQPLSEPNPMGTNSINQANVMVNNIYGTDTQYEPSIAIGPKTNNIYLIWLDDRWENAKVIYSARSTDGGKTFEAIKIVNKNISGVPGSPELAVDKNENLYVVWYDNRNLDYDLWFQKSIDKGDSWLKNDVFINDEDPLYNQTNPTLAVDNSHNPPTIWVAWQDPTKYSDSHDGIYITHSANAGVDFFSPKEVYTNSQKRNATDPDIAIDNQGYVWLTWSEPRTGVNDQSIYYTRSTAAAEPGVNNPSFGFTAKVDNGPTGTNQTKPVIAVFNHTIAYIAWEDDRSGLSTDIYFSRYSSSSNNFLSSYRINKDKGELTNQFGPSIALNYTSGHIYISWLDGRNGYYETYLARSTNNGVSFSNEVLVNDAFRNMRAVEPMSRISQNNLAVDMNENLHITYAQNRYGNQDIFYQRSNNYGATWSSSIMVNENGTEGFQRNYYQYQIAIDTNNVIHIVWEDNRALNFSIGTDIYYAKSYNSGLTFTPGVIVNYVTNSIQKNPCIALNDSWIYIAWTEAPDISQGGDIMFSYSKDGGTTFEYNIISETNFLVNGGESQQNDHASIAVNESGDVFIVYHGQDFMAVPPLVDDMDIYIAYSNYNPVSEEFELFQQFSVNNDTSSTTINDQYNPCITIDKNNENIYVAFEDSRNISRNSGIVLAVSNTTSMVFDYNYQVDDEINDSHVFSTVHKNPSVFVNSTGAVSVVWHDDREGYNNIYYAKSMDYGQNFSANLRVNSNLANDKTMPTIYQGSNETIFVTWEDYRNGNADIYIAKSTNGGNTFQTEVRVDNDNEGYDQMNPAIVVNSTGLICVLWTDQRGYHSEIESKSDLYISRSYNGGNTFGEDYCVHTYQAEPAIAVDTDGTIYVVWTDHRFGKWDIFFAKSTNGGQYFSVNKPLNDNRENSRGNPDITVQNRVLYIVWEDAREAENNKTIIMVKSTDGGRNFGKNIDISNQLGSQLNPAITIDKSGIAHAVWQDNFAPNKQLLYYANSTNWGGKKSVFNFLLNLNLWNPDIAVDDGQTPYKIYIAFENRTLQNNWEISFSKSNDGGGKFQNSILINDDSVTARQANPAIDADSSGNAIIVWEDNRDGSFDIYGALSNDGGTTFSLNSVINSSILDERRPDIVMNNSLAVVIFQSNNNTQPNNNYNVFATISSKSTLNFVNTFRIDDSGANIQNQIKPRIATDGSDSFYAVWEDYRYGNADIFFNMSDETIPVADAGPDHYIDQNEIVHFLADNSWDNVGIANYTWTFLDVTTKNLYGFNTKYLFSKPGDYLVTLTVKDYYNNQATDTAWVFVRDKVPPSYGVDSTPQVAYTGDSFTIKVIVTDNYQLSKVYLKYYYGSDGAGSPTIVQMSPTAVQDQFGYTIATIPHITKRLVYLFNANDTTNNWNNISIPVVIPIIDNDLPEIGQDNTPSIATTGDPFTFTVKCTDNIKVESGNVEYWFGTGSPTTQPLTLSGSDYTYTISNIPDSLSTLHYRFNFQDNSTIVGGPNINTSAVKDVTVNDNDPPTFGADNSDTTAYTDKSFKFSLQFNDNIGTKKAMVYYWFGSSTIKQTKSLTLTSGSWEGTITIPNKLENLKYNFTFWDTSNNFGVTTEKEVTVSDDIDPLKISGSGNIDTTTGESFELFAEFSDNVGIGLVKVYYQKEGTVTWSQKSISTPTNNKYQITNDELGIDTRNSTLGWKYYFYAEDTSQNSNTYGTDISPYTISVTDNDAPIAKAAVKDGTNKKIGDTVTFDGSGSKDNINIEKYSWTFTYDGAPKVLQGETPNFKFDIAGEYEITLKVWDEAENTGSDIVTLYVTSEEIKPEVVLGSPAKGVKIKDSFVTLTWHTTHPSYQLVEYDLYFGDQPNPPLFEQDIADEGTSESSAKKEIEDLEDKKTYYWYIIGKIGTNVGPKSEERSFSIDFDIITEYGVTITSDKTLITIKQGESQTVTLTVTNTGTSVDLFNLTVEKGLFPDVVLQHEEQQLTAQESGTNKLTFNTEQNTPIQKYTITVTATSKESKTEVVSASVSIEVDVVKEVVKLDSDNDQLPDAWEIEHFGDIITYDGNDDPDKDGYTNLQELQKGSDPLDENDPDKQDDGKDDGEDNTMMIFGGVAVVIIIVVVLLLLLMMKKKGGKGKGEAEKPEEPMRAPAKMAPKPPTTGIPSKPGMTPGAPAPRPGTPGTPAQRPPAPPGAGGPKPTQPTQQTQVPGQPRSPGIGGPK